MAATKTGHMPLDGDPLWYKDAILYELHVRAFYDSDGDGVGDFRGLYLPVVVDPEYHYEAVNVEVQRSNPHSLLRWMKRLIALRKRHKAFGRGTLEMLTPRNRAILAFIRRHGQEIILVAANVSRIVQGAELDPSAFRGHVPVELFGGGAFPAIGELPYFLTLGPHSFYWFSLARPGYAAPDADHPGGAG